MIINRRYIYYCFAKTTMVFLTGTVESQVNGPRIGLHVLHGSRDRYADRGCLPVRQRGQRLLLLVLVQAGPTPVRVRPFQVVADRLGQSPVVVLRRGRRVFPVTRRPDHRHPEPDHGEHDAGREHDRADVPARRQQLVELDGRPVGHHGLHVAVVRGGGGGGGTARERVLGRYQVARGHRHQAHCGHGQPERRVHAAAVPAPPDLRRFHAVPEVVAVVLVLRIRKIILSCCKGRVEEKKSDYFRFFYFI